MSGPLAAFISDSINLGLGDIWAAGGPEYVRQFQQQTILCPRELSKHGDDHTMRTAVRGEQWLLAQYPLRRKSA
jgi:2-keto-4-pentenoate hydratase/2-oxohepta-3-ene-1,7-dioic acid hydratase in catechol pathway